MAFNEAQQAAILHRDGPMMVLAGPGSGKTTVITHRVRYLTEELKVPPGDILVITFTRAAAREMKERYEKMTGKRSAVSFGTFHSVFFRILKLAYRYTADNILKEDEQQKLLRELVKKSGMEPEDENEFLSSLTQEISRVKGERMDLKHYYSSGCPDEIFRSIYLGYEKALRETGKMDFDDMLVFTWELFSERKDILAAWQKKYRYILIDEFQDINRLQYEVIRMMALPENNLFIVGDDDQSIYRFRGARPEIMLGFFKDYPGAERILLDVNYRCTEEIKEASLRLIRHNKKRFDKEIRTTGRHGKPVSVRVFPDTAAENRAIAKEIAMYMESGVPAREIAVLYRTNSCPRFLMETLLEQNLPFRTRDSVPNLYDHWISRDILTYLRMAGGSRDRKDFFRIMNRPLRYISREAVPGPLVDFDELEAFYADKDWMAERIHELKTDLAAVSRMAPQAAVHYIRKAMEYDGYLGEYAAARRIKKEELLETADELEESASRFAGVTEWFDHMEAYRKELERQASMGLTDTDAVMLSTMHSAKGLEFSVVYILDASEGVTPHGRSVLPEDIEEERRLFYVAMTRAKSRLHICSAKERWHRPAEVSRFVPELTGDGPGKVRQGG